MDGSSSSSSSSSSRQGSPAKVNSVTADRIHAKHGRPYQSISEYDQGTYAPPFYHIPHDFYIHFMFNDSYSHVARRTNGRISQLRPLVVLVVFFSSSIECCKIYLFWAGIMLLLEYCWSRECKNWFLKFPVVSSKFSKSSKSKVFSRRSLCSHLMTFLAVVIWTFNWTY